MKLRDFINSTLLRNKPYVMSKVHSFQKTNPQFNFKDYFELVVAHQLTRRPDFFFIQIGANDGILADDLRPLIIKYNLSGICIEPLEDKFEALTKTYEKYPQVKLINVALHPTEKSFTLYRVDKSAKNLPLCAQGIASFEKQHLTSILRKMVSNAEDVIVEERVPCVQFEHIFESEKLDHLELLQIDTEGFDYEIIKMINFNIIKPAIIRFEINHLSEKDKIECLNHLAINNYKMIYTRTDVIAVDQATIN